MVKLSMLKKISFKAGGTLKTFDEMLEKVKKSATTADLPMENLVDAILIIRNENDDYSFCSTGGVKLANAISMLEFVKNEFIMQLRDYNDAPADGNEPA